MPQPLDVEPRDLLELAATFDQQSGVLADAVPRLEGPALDVNDAFGLLGPSEELLREYLDFAVEAIDGLRNLSTILAGAAVGLETNADNYAAADTDSTIPSTGR